LHLSIMNCLVFKESFTFLVETYEVLL